MREFDLDAFIAEEDNALIANSIATANKSPEQSAEIYRFSRNQDLPFEYVERHPEIIKRPDVQSLPPTVKSILADRQKYAIAQDDLENLTWWEQTGREAKNVAKLLPATAKSISSAGYAGLGSIFNTLSELTLAPIRALDLASEEDIIRGDFLGATGKYLTDIAKQERAGSEYFMPKEGETALPAPVLGGVKSAITNIPALGVGVLTRNPNVALGLMGGVTYGDSYLTAQESGLSNLESVMYATNNTIAEVATERLPAFKLLEDIGANAGFFKTIAAQMALEIPTEQIATIWQDVSEWASINPDKTLSEFIAERPDAAVDTLISTVVATGLQTSVISGIDRLVYQREQKQIEEFAEKAQESKVNQRSPEVFSEFLQEASDTENLYIDARQVRELYQDLKQDPALQIIDEQLEEAEAVGGDIVISMADFATKFAKSENFSKLKEHLRLSPESPTQADLEVPPVEKITDILKTANENIEIQKRSDEIFNEVKDQLIQTGRQNKQTAKVSAALYPAFVTTMSVRSGLSVDEIYTMMGLRIVGPDTDVRGSGVILDQMFPEDNRVISLSESLQERIKTENPSLKDVDIASNPTITVYRATIGDSLRKDDFVAIERDVAEQHLQNLEDRGETGSIIEQQVPVGDLLMGNDATEFVYWPQRILNQSYTPEDLEFFKSQGLLTDEEAARLESDETARPEPQTTERRTVGGKVPRQAWSEATVVKADGRPADVWRGAAQPLQSQDFESLGQATGHPSASLGVWFSSDPVDAATYGTPSKHQLDIRNPKEYDADTAPEFDTSEEYTRLVEQLKTEGHDGIVIDYRDLGGPVHFVAFEADQVIEGGRDLFQDEGKGPRGVISLLPQESIIKLTEASDPSTFLHESGHLFLEMEGRLYSHPNANESIKQDGDIILEWLGAESFEAVTTEQHEQFARGFEKYLGEGKAPSVELQSVFRRFAAWLKQVYRSLTRLNVELNDDIRGVFDRMLATDEQIDRMKGRFRPLFETAEEAGATEAEYRAYKEQATPEAAKEALRAKLLKQFQRQHKQWWRDESAVIAKQVRKDLLENPLYAATEALKGNQPVSGFDNLKLSKAVVRGWLGEVGPKFRGMTADDGMGADDLAALFGFASGFEMIDLIQNEPTLAQEVKRLTEKEMVQRHGDALTDGTLAEMAEQAVHNVEHAKKLTQEIAFLARKTKQPAIDREALKEFAREKIGALPYKKIYPSRYRANEVRSARAAAVAKAQGDNRLALQHKQQELVNFYLAKEAQMQRDKAQKIRSRLKAIQTKKYDSKRYDNNMVNEAKVLIAAFDFRKNNRESVELATARLSSVRNWIESQQQKPENVTTFVEAEILGRVIPYDEMTTEDLQGVNDVAQSILFAAKKAMEADSEAYKREIAETAEYLEKNRIDTYETEIDTDTPWVRTKSTIQELFASLRKMESLVRQADGMNEQGMLWKKVIKPLLDASNNALAMRTQAHAHLNDIFNGFESAFNGLRDRRQVTLDSGRKVTMSYGARLSLALNMGNDSNMEALLSQGKTTPDSKPYMTERDINRIVATLSEKDLDLVQSIWDYIDTYWPQISELEIKRSGVAPQKVQPREFTTPSGKVMRGGYYPLVGDPIEDSKQLDQDISAQAQQRMQGGTAKKSTRHGSTIERIGFGGKKVDLSINVLFNHIDGIIHDITHWEAVRDVDRVLRHPKIQNELNTSLGKPGARAIKDRLTEVAAGPQRINGMRGWNRVLRHARMAATFGALGYSVRTSITNMLGLTSAAMEMDARTVAGGAAEYYWNIKTSNEFILSKSKYMRDRGEVLNRDIAFIRNNLKGDTRWNKIKDNAFWMMTQTDKAITRPIWMAAYRQGETMFDTEQAAIDHADRMVARTQGSGLDMDLSNVETRNELMKAMTVMFSAMNAIYNITTEQVKRRKAGKINTAQLAAKLTWGIVVAGIAEEMIRGSWDDDEDETLPGKVAASTANMALSLIPVGRDIASYAQYGSSFPTPIVQLGLAPVDVAKQSAQGEIDKAFVRSLTAMSAWALVPGGAQANRTIGYLIDLNEGEIDEFSPWGLIVTGKE